MEVSDEFKIRLTEASKPVKELFKKQLETDDPFIKAEIQHQIEDILFPFVDELMIKEIEKQFDNFATYKPLENKLDNRFSSNYDWSKYGL